MKDHKKENIIEMLKIKKIINMFKEYDRKHNNKK